MSVEAGDRVRLTGAGWDNPTVAGVRRGAIRVARGRERAGAFELEGPGYVAFNREDSFFAAKPLPKRTTIYIVAWRVPESSAGFEWRFERDEAEAIFRDSTDVDTTFVEMHIAFGNEHGTAPTQEQRGAVTDWIDGEIQDLIEFGRLGRILGRHYVT